MFCSNCGISINRGDKFCSGCGKGKFSPFYNHSSGRCAGKYDAMFVSFASSTCLCGRRRVAIKLSCSLIKRLVSGTLNVIVGNVTR